MLFTDRFTQALVFATQLHARQVRKGGDIPYISHLLGVASIAIEHGADEDEAIAALLHDAIEDQGNQTSRAEIEQRFGAKVREIVDGCTDTDIHPKPPWRQRKEAYIHHLKTASPSVRLVSMSDKLHNARSILTDYRAHGESVWERFTGKKDGTLWYYRSIVNTLKEIETRSLLQELEHTIAELESLRIPPHAES
jgi:GTP pyrophosphokinase